MYEYTTWIQNNWKYNRQYGTKAYAYLMECIVKQQCNINKVFMQNLFEETQIYQKFSTMWLHRQSKPFLIENNNSFHTL